MLEHFSDRFEESIHRNVLAQVQAAKLTKSSYQRISNLLSKYPKMKILPGWAYFVFEAYQDIQKSKVF